MGSSIILFSYYIFFEFGLTVFGPLGNNNNNLIIMAFQKKKHILKSSTPHESPSENVTENGTMADLKCISGIKKKRKNMQ